MSKNLLGMEIYKESFYSIVLENLRNILVVQQHKTLENIQIEIKYADFIHLFPSQCPSRKPEDQFKYTDQAVLYALNLVSFQYPIFLNTLKRDNYKINAGFNEQKHRKFYHIKEYLIKLCQFNAKHQVQSSKLQPRNIYEEASLIASNSQFYILEENQLRFDIYLTNYAPEKLRGRYSYESKKGWVKINKIALAEQLDFILAERPFRLAANEENQSTVTYQDLLQMQEAIKKPRTFDIRLKNSLRVMKGEITEFSLSEIYEPKDPRSVFPEIQSMITEDSHVLDQYLKQKFVNFYTVGDQTQNKFQIQCEFTKKSVKRMKKMLLNHALHELKLEIETAVEDLYALYFADHSTKKKEVSWLNKLSQQNILPEARLENQYGTYMRDQIFESMQAEEDQ